MIIQVTDPTHSGEARRRAAICAEHAKLPERESGSLAIVATEMATNLFKHAGQGSMIVEVIEQNGNSGVRILGLDKGPGIRDLTTALQDGYSTAGTGGNGLGAIKRLSTVFDIYTAPGLGTAVLAEIWPNHPPNKNNHNGTHQLSPLEFGVVSIPIKGEDVCGDGWGVKKTAESMLLMVVDGLGHGILAADAAREAEKVFAASRTDSPAPILQDSHDALRKTRGSAMAVASLNIEKRLISFAGVGNIGSSIVTQGSSRGMASHNGIVGHQMQRVQEFSFPWNSDSILVMHSDGLKSAWDLKLYPGVWSKRPGLIAGILYRDFTRERDDVTILIAKNRAEVMS